MSVKSLGIHLPTGLSYLVSESLLPPNPEPSQYCWTTYCSTNSSPQTKASKSHPDLFPPADEELLYTSTAVVYSRGGTVDRTFRFEVEGQAIHGAYLANWKGQKEGTFEVERNIGTTEGGWFRRGVDSLPSLSSPVPEQDIVKEKKGKPDKDGERENSGKGCRAVVVLLKLQAHIFLLSGASYVVNLPFEVESVFALPQGLLLQRKLVDRKPEIRSAEELLELERLNLDGLDLEFGLGGLDGPDDDLPRHFALSDPLSEVGLVVTPSLEDVDKSEDIVYVSTRDELANIRSKPGSPLTLVVTSNASRRSLSLWVASHVPPKRLSDRTAQVVQRRQSVGRGLPGLTPFTPGFTPGFAPPSGLPAVTPARAGFDMAGLASPRLGREGTNEGRSRFRAKVRRSLDSGDAEVGTSGETVTVSESEIASVGETAVDGLQREIVLTRIREVPVDAGFSKLRAFVIAHPRVTITRTTSHYRLFIHIVFKTREKHHWVLYLNVKHFVPPGGSARPSFELNVAEFKRFRGHIDVTKVDFWQHGKLESRVASLIRDREGALVLALRDGGCMLPAIRIPLDDLRFDQRVEGAQDEGRRRLAKVSDLVGFEHPDSWGGVSVRDSLQRLHRLQIVLGGENVAVSRCVEVVKLALDEVSTELFLHYFWDNLAKTGVTNSWPAFVSALFAVILSAVHDTKVIARLGKIRPVRETDVAVQQLELGQTSGNPWLNSAAWGWTQHMPSSQSGPSGFSGQAGTSSSSEKEVIFVSSCIQRSLQAKAEYEATYFREIPSDTRISGDDIRRVLVGLHLLREETKLNKIAFAGEGSSFAAVLAQIGNWIGWPGWGSSAGTFFWRESEDVASSELDHQQIFASEAIPGLEVPPSIYSWTQQFFFPEPWTEFPTMDVVVYNGDTVPNTLTSRTDTLRKYFKAAPKAADAAELVEVMVACGITKWTVESLPESVAAILQEPIVRSRADPPMGWNSELLTLVGRMDLAMIGEPSETNVAIRPMRDSRRQTTREICIDTMELPSESDEKDDEHISRLVFPEDRRLQEALSLVDPERVPLIGADYSRLRPEILAKLVTDRTFSLPPGFAIIQYHSARPLPTEKIRIPSFDPSPGIRQVSASRKAYSEENWGWAWFHSGVVAGLSVVPDLPGIDTSWIGYNRPEELHSRHAGLLLGLGLNGHLKALSKRHSFKYLAAKHTMTSIGLSLGLAASHKGKMDTLITRMLSVQLTCMLPPGSAELNVDPCIQSAGLMGIGLLYAESKHWRMSEVMLGELESDNLEEEAGRAIESYRLAAGFSLGLINLAKGGEFFKLHQGRILDPLLKLVTGSRPTDMIHILDKSTAGATIALALIYMKTNNEDMARSIDVPDTVIQFDYVRPDILLLRTLAKHLVMWDSIQPTEAWLISNLPKEYQPLYQLDFKSLSTRQLPLYNIVAGLVWAVALRYAGSGDTKARDLVLRYLDRFITLVRLPTTTFTGKTAIYSVRNCQSLLALSASIVMAGTGDLPTLRRLRRLHGHLSPSVTYGSHMATHMAVGFLFFGRGLYTVSTSPLGIAALMPAMYPLFPSYVKDNSAHLQAFRHLWPLAAVPRCLIVRDVTTQQAVPIPIRIVLRSGDVVERTAPCLLPAADTIRFVRTESDQFWPVTVDFARPQHGRVAIGGTVFVRQRAGGLLRTRMRAGWIGDRAGAGTETGDGDGDGDGEDEMDVHSTTADHVLWLRRMLSVATGGPGGAGRTDVNLLLDLRGVLRWADAMVSNKSQGRAGPGEALAAAAAGPGVGELAWVGREVVDQIREDVWLNRP